MEDDVKERIKMLEGQIISAIRVIEAMDRDTWDEIVEWGEGKLKRNPELDPGPHNIIKAMRGVAELIHEGNEKGEEEPWKR